MKKRIRIIGAFSVVVFLSVLAVVIFVNMHRPKGMREDFERLSIDEYNGVFVSSFSIQEYDEEIFAVNRGVPTVLTQFAMRSLEDYADYFNEVWDSGNVITNVYMGIDPYETWLEAGKKDDKWNALIDDMLSRYILAHQDVSFEILLPYDSLERWKQDQNYEEKLQVYFSFVDKMDDYTNVTQYFIGGEEWVIANPQNYTESGITPELARHVSLLVFCDHEYVIASGNAEILLGRLRTLMESEEEQYPDFSDYSFVYLGDSIIATAHGSYAIPGIVQGLTGAKGYNLAVGGSPASAYSEGEVSFVNAVSAFLDKNVSFLPDTDLEEYIKTDAGAKKQVILLNYGLNDYFSGRLLDNPENEFDATTYGGALRTGIQLLGERLPDAKIVVMAPTYTIEFSAGTEDLSGQGYVLTDYVEKASSVAQQMGVLFMNNYEELGIGEENYQEYLVDGCHPNDNGRFLLAEAIVKKLSNSASEE